ncbi:Alcohol dehydrogenase zinc-binding domain protein [Chitinophaga pinensis DSM 2588]|uniref:Alcohol dehydrogenase zinc-binding domain protein n=2 Tax=Chitinophaga pinensis TaxID=79329 RepID=A0A979G3G3_CHIPD|nr:Alcohol dehydrogenase zinc-binding domain protein [Chitinophaga pinensis DSM 2588]
MDKQKAVIQLQYGNSRDALIFSDTHPVNELMADEVKIRVYATSVNPIDWQMMEGNRRLIHKRTFPFVPFFDIAGDVVAVGSSVRRFKTGDAVYCDNKINGGGLSEYVNVKEDLVSIKPANISYAAAAAVPLAAQTAYLALTKGGLTKNSRVCIIGASGGVGSFAVQIAKALGASTVIGVCSKKNSDFVRSLGADITVDYTTTKWAGLLDKNSLDMVIDCVGGKEQWLDAKKVLRSQGRFVTIARDEDEKVTVPSALKLAVNIGLRMISAYFGRKIAYVPVFLDASHTLLDKVSELIQAGRINPWLGKIYTFNMDNVHQVIQESKTGRMVGKTVIQIAGDK